MITDINQLDLNKSYTYADYLTWQFDDMVELIRGKVFKMSPAPSRIHQQVSSKLHILIGSYLLNKQCHIYHAPFDVRLPLPPNQQKQNKINTVVQPDLSIICDTTKLDSKGCNGAPDWVIEILSPGTSHKDLNEKYDIYRHAGVREYWIVHPTDATVIPYRLNKKTGDYELLRNRPFTIGEKVPVSVFESFEIDLKLVFD